MLGRYTSDLEVGDVMGPERYTLSPFVVREYSHSNELHHPWFQGRRDDLVMTPTLIHLDKLRLYYKYCPQGAGPHARIHYEYDCTVHEPVKVGMELEVTGTVTERFTKRGRDHVVTMIELREAATGKLMITYRDTVLLSFVAKGGEKA